MSCNETTETAELSKSWMTASGAFTDVYLIEGPAFSDFVTMHTTFEHQTRPTRAFAVGINAAISKTVTIHAETIEEAKLKAKQVARELFEADLLIQTQE